MKLLWPYLLTAAAILSALFFVPKEPIDPWGLISLYSLLRLLLLLMVIQILSYTIMTYLKGHKGGFLLGFLGGLISSTALTASLAKQSHDCSEDEVRLLSLAYLSALLGMVVEGLILVFVGVGEMHWELLWVFAGPILMTVGLLIWRVRKLQEIKFQEGALPPMGVGALIILGLVVAAFLILSKLLQKTLGQTGQFVLTFLVCLFELHGSIIGNVQLHERNIIDIRTLGNLIALGLFSSYLAKMSLVLFMGSDSLKKRVAKYSLWLMVSLFVGWGIFTS
ncbi:MAG: DUF4010 domain-containing protein, partial [Bdellovibrio sp.]|nr:DUF4010 domain-containing protein [Bdellovibrio sp.]